MKKILATAAAGLMLAAGAPAIAADDTYKAQSPEVVERNAQGKATKVLVENIIYEVCMSEAQDHCIQPRAARLGWGDRPLSYWPGERRG